MDLSYLGFLLSSFSLALLFFSGLLVVWPFLHLFSEIGFGDIKMKVAFAPSLASLMIVLLVFQAIAWVLLDTLEHELQARSALTSMEHDRAAWANLWRDLTQGWDHGAFAFLRVADVPMGGGGGSSPFSYGTRRELQYSLVQQALMWTFFFVPVVYLAWEFLRGGWFDFFPGWVGAAMVAAIWCAVINNGVTRTHEAIFEIARLGVPEAPSEPPPFSEPRF